MSYEGYTQYICANHHEYRVQVFTVGIPIDIFGEPICSICGASPVWANEVDLTNGCSHPRGESNSDGHNSCCAVELECMSQGEIQECNDCAFVSVKAPTYRIPRKGVGRRLRAASQLGCHANGDGDCVWENCPQLRDGEPAKTGRHCPLPYWGDNYL